MTCQHQTIITWNFADDAEPAGMWSCAKCGKRFVPMTQLEAEVKAEREACAVVCEDGINNATDWDSSIWDQACMNRAFAIRAKGQA